MERQYQCKRAIRKAGIFCIPHPRRSQDHLRAQRWEEAGGLILFWGPRAHRGFCNYLLLAAEKNPNSTQKPGETPYNASQNLILLVPTAAVLRIHLCFLNCEGTRLSCPLAPKAGPLSHVRSGTRPLGSICQGCGHLCNVTIHVWTSSG